MGVPGAVARRVDPLGRRDAFHGVSFEVRKGEVLGFAGLVGSGRTEVAEALFGVQPADEGTIERDGVVVSIGSPRGLDVGGRSLPRHPSDALR